MLIDPPVARYRAGRLLFFEGAFAFLLRFYAEEDSAGCNALLGEEILAGINHAALNSSLADALLHASPVPVALADYDIDKPTMGPVASIDDDGSFEAELG